MTFAVMARKLNRVAAIYRESGLRGLTSRLTWRIGRRNQAFLKWKSQADAAFDAFHGTDTGGVDELHKFKVVGANAKYGHSHIATDPKHFAEMMDGLAIDFAPFTFIDLGSGKGRALILAAAYPFRRIIGVEFAAELHRAAEANVAAFSRNRSPGSPILLVHADVATYEFPNEPLIIFLFNPFSPVIIRRVADRAIASWRVSPRPMIVLYMFPTYLSAFPQSDWQIVEQTHTYARLVPDPKGREEQPISTAAERHRDGHTAS
jgi:SAM-dependent methyltransferase